MRCATAMLLASSLVGCLPESSSAVVSAEALTEGCVGSALDLIQELGDRLAPLSEVATLEEFERLAEAQGSRVELSPDGVTPHVLVFDLVELRDGAVALTARVQFYAGDVIEPDPATSDRMVAWAEAGSATHFAEGVHEFRAEPGVGIHASGFVSGNYGDCVVDADFPALLLHAVADLPDRPVGVVCTSGTIDLQVSGPDWAAVGTAAFTGRDAFVVLTTNGGSYHGSVPLRPTP